MKTKILVFFFSAMAACLSLQSCYQSADTLIDAKTEVSGTKSVTFQFNPFEMSQSPLDEETRAITAKPTTLLVVDVMEGEVKGVTQLSTASVEGMEQVDDVLSDLTLDLEYGDHTLYILAASRVYESFDADQLLVSWGQSGAALGYTWAQKINLSVSNQSSSEKSVSLPLVIGAVTLKCLDAQDPDIKKMSVSGQDICWSLDLSTMKGLPLESGVALSFAYDPASGFGKDKMFSVFSFEPTVTGGATPTVGTVTFTALRADNSVIASHALSNVPLRAGYRTLYEGLFYSSSTGFSLTLADDWSGTYNYTY